MTDILCIIGRSLHRLDLPHHDMGLLFDMTELLEPLPVVSITLKFRDDALRLRTQRSLPQ